MTSSIKRILMTGATGYVADQMLPTFKEKYETVLIDTRTENRRGEKVENVNVVDLIDPDTNSYKELFADVDAVIHLAYKRRSGDPLRKKMLRWPTMFSDPHMRQGLKEWSWLVQIMQPIGMNTL